MFSAELRHKCFSLLEGDEKDSFWGRFINVFIFVLIITNVIVVIVESVEPIHQKYIYQFRAFELISIVLFTLEYIVRLWTCVELDAYKDKKHPRWDYAKSPMAIIDLLAILPFYLGIFFTLDLRFLRMMRLYRVFKLTRYSSAMQLLIDVFREESRALIAGLFIIFVLLIFAASGAYYVENEAQPESFGSIPKAMWWAITTISTVGYGDVVPITMAGKVFGGLVAVLGIWLAALPAGILASGFADQLHFRRQQLEDEFRHALEDGLLEDHEEDKIEEIRQRLGVSMKKTKQIRREVEREMALRQCPKCGAKLNEH